MPFHLYVSLRNDDCIKQFEMNAKTGALTLRGETEAVGGPGHLALNPAGDVLYTGYRGHGDGVYAGGDGTPKDEFGFGSFAIDQKGGALKPMNRQRMPGEPSYLRTDRRGKFLLSSYFQAGHCAVNRIEADGRVGECIEWRVTNGGAHSVQIDASNRYMFVPHIGVGNGGILILPPGLREPANAIYQFKFDSETGRLTENDPLRVGPPRRLALGPRHGVFHPAKPWLYICNEQIPSVSHYTLDEASGQLKLGKTVSNLPRDADLGQITTCADIQISKDGRFLYAPNRGHNTIASYTVDQSTGELTPTGWARADARPRAFILEPTGSFLYAVGLTTGRITCYRISGKDGSLTEQESIQAGVESMGVVVAEVRG